MKSFQGSFVALVTPFKSGRVDEAALRKLVDWQIAQGIHGLVPCGTTGEAPTLSYEEHERIVSIVVEQAAKKVPVLAGCGSNSTENAIRLAKQAKKAGADGQLQLTPYYNKPTQQGLFLHFEAIAKAVDLPMVLYNVAGRTAVNLETATTLRLAQIATIVGSKEAHSNLEQVKAIIDDAPEGFVVLSGEDALNLKMYSLGGQGSISVTANVAPSKVARIWNLHSQGEVQEALQAQEALQPLNKGMFMETNPIPAKTSLAMMGRCAEEFRLPLCPISPDKRPELTKLLKSYSLV